MADDPDLARYVEAQDAGGTYARALAELKAGRKQSHWMWFVFPQLAVLGRSAMARHYGLSGLEEARAYLAHPVLGPRLTACCTLLLPHQGRSAREIFGDIDAMKLRSCLTLFEQAAPDQPVFRQTLQAFFGGAGDPLTLAGLNT